MTGRLCEIAKTGAVSDWVSPQAAGWHGKALSPTGVASRPCETGSAVAISGAVTMHAVTSWLDETGSTSAIAG